MKKIYSIIIAVLVGLTFESGASSGESSKSIWCKGAALQCRSLGGITRYQKNGCQDMGDRQVLSKCYLTFCKLNCQALPGKGCPTGAVLDKCKEVCGSLYYGNEAIHNDIAECVGDKMLTLPETRAMKIRLDTQKAEAGETTNLSQVKKWYNYIKKLCDEGSKFYVGSTFWGQVTYVKDYAKMIDKLIAITKTLQVELKRGRSNYGGYKDFMNKATADVQNFSAKVDTLVTGFEKTYAKTLELKEKNELLIKTTASS